MSSFLPDRLRHLPAADRARVHGLIVAYKARMPVHRYCLVPTIVLQVAAAVAGCNGMPFLMGMLYVAAVGALAAAGIATLWASQHAMRQVLLRENICPATCFDCGYDLRGTTGPTCPECGATVRARG